MQTKMKAGIYLRVSTRDKQSVGMQEKSIKDFCEREQIEITKIYSDVGESGSKESRPEFDNLLNDMRNKKFDCIIVYKLDRIGRSISHLLKLFEEFSKKDIKFISITQNFNTTTPEGRLFLRMMMLLAEYERELTISRINSGLDRVRAEGRTLGRPSGSKDKKRRIKSGYYLRWGKKSTP
jgi:DNA invertase Pin-like site-specific DNA recombinase